MTQQKYLGKITAVTFGDGEYQDSMIGLYVDFEFDGSCVISSFKGNWSPEHITWTPGCKWSEADRDASFAELVRYVAKLLKQAKVSDITELKGKPVELIIEGNSLKSWRILTEVL